MDARRGQEAIEQQEGQYDWTFPYLSANQDAIEVGSNLGIPAEGSLTYSAGNVADAMVAYSASSTMLRGAVGAGMNLKQARARSAYSPAQRAAALGQTDKGRTGTGDTAAPAPTKPNRLGRRGR